MADHIFDTTDMNYYQKNTENTLNSQISALTAKKTQLTTKLSTAKSKLSAAQSWNSNSENTSKIDTGPIEAEINQIESDISTIDGQVSELNAAITDTREFIRNLINTVTTTDGNYSLTLKKMNQSIKEYTDKMGKMSENFKNMGLTSKNEEIRKLTLSFSSDLQTNFSKAFNLNEGAVTTVKEVFLEGLPQDLKNLITINDLIATDDGFAMCLKDISVLSTSLGYTNINGYDLSLYTSWYLYGISDVNLRNTVYSILKMRIPSEEGDNRGVSIPFVSFDINEFYPDNSNFGKIIYSMTNAGIRSKADKILMNYFSNIDSKGSYLIAESMLNKIIQSNNENTFNYKQTGASKVDRIMEYLRSNESITLNESAGTFTVNSWDQNAERAILAIHTGNTSFNSFAGEVRYHADAAIDSNYGKYLGGTALNRYIDSLIFGAGIKADMAPGEEESKDPLFSKLYLNDDSVYVNQQRNKYGEK